MGLPAGYQLDTPAKGLPPGYKLDSEPEAPKQEGFVSSLVKGLKTFTGPLGAGSTTTKEESQATVDRIRNHPLRYALDQIPIAGQVMKMLDQSGAGKSGADIAGEAIGETIAGLGSAPPVPVKGPAPVNHPARAATARYGGQMAEAPKASKPVNSGDLMRMAKTGKDIFHVLASPNPITKLSALGRLVEKFTSEAVPIEAPPPVAPPVPEYVITPQGPVTPPLRPVPPGAPAARVMPQGPVRPPLSPQAPAVAPPTIAEAPAPSLALSPEAVAGEADLISQLEESIRLAQARKGKAPGPVVSEANSALNESLKPKYAAQGEAVHAANAGKMALRFAKAIKESGYDSLVDSMGDQHWQAVADSMGEGLPSPATRQIAKDLLRMGQEEPVTAGSLMKNKGRISK